MKINYIIWMLIVLAFTAGCAGVTGNAAKDVKQASFAEDVKEFNVKAFQWGYEPATITVNKGDKVRITAESQDSPHGLAIDEFGVNMYLDGVSGSKTTEFIADEAGIFTIYCTVPCGRGHGSMKGKLIVNS